MSTMKNHSGSFLSRLVLPGLVAPLILLSPALVRADAITTFVVSGTARNAGGDGTLDSCAVGATCPFSGTFQVDTTTGTVESSGFHINFPGLPSHELFVSMQAGTLWEIQEREDDDAILILDFTTAPTPGSLVGFTGGMIVGNGVFFGLLSTLFDSFSGSITPAPEPSSRLLFATGMLVLGLTRRFGKKAAHPLSA